MFALTSQPRISRYLWDEVFEFAITDRYLLTEASDGSMDHSNMSWSLVVIPSHEKE